MYSVEPTSPSLKAKRSIYFFKIGSYFKKTGGSLPAGGWIITYERRGYFLGLFDIRVFRGLRMQGSKVDPPKNFYFFCTDRYFFKSFIPCFQNLLYLIVFPFGMQRSQIDIFHIKEHFST